MSHFLGICRRTIRARNMSFKTEKSYIHWIKRYILYNSKQHPEKLGEDEVIRFLTWLASDRQCSSSTQRQAMCALVFLYKHVLNRELGNLDSIKFAKKRVCTPVVLDKDEVAQIISCLKHPHLLIVSLMYGSGLRVSEALGLRVKDVDLSACCLYVRNGKGGKDRVVTLSSTLIEPLRKQIRFVASIHCEDLRLGYGAAPVPVSLRRKLGVSVKQLSWQFVFPSASRCAAPDTAEIVRYHQHPDTVRKAITAATRKRNINKRVTCHVFRHSFATHLLQSGVDIRKVQVRSCRCENL